MPDCNNSDGSHDLESVRHGVIHALGRLSLENSESKVLMQIFIKMFFLTPEVYFAFYF